MEFVGFIFLHHKPSLREDEPDIKVETREEQCRNGTY